PHLTVRHVKGRNPVRIVVDSRGRTPLNSRVLDSNARTIIAVSKKASPARIKKLKETAEVIVSGKTKVNLVRLMKAIRSIGIKTILLEGGGRLNKSMIEQNLIDEIYLTLTPILLGDGIRWINGKIKKYVALKYAGCTSFGDQLVVHYLTK
ncbi:MAG: dihydrofolate reductase family protein, partial [Candidatus Altiarchaeota archaeon]